MNMINAFSYGAAAICFSLLTVLLLTSWRGRLQGGLLVVACVLSVIWSSLLALRGIGVSLSLNTVFLVEVLRTAAWIIFVTALAASLGVSRVTRWLAHASWAVSLVVGIVMIVLRWQGLLQETVGAVMIMGGISMGLVGLILIEQVYRVAPAESRWALKFLCLGIAGMFAYDLVLFSHAYVMQAIDERLWGARGFASALMVPLVAIAARRNPHWSVDIFVSRHVVFYSAVLTAAGIYLVVISVAGLYVRQYGGAWGDVAQIILVFAAVVGLLGLMASGTLRARVKVFLAKHFYRNRYDYRDEWLRLIETLSAGEALADARQLSIKAMAQILQCRGGVLWSWDRDDGRYVPVAAVGEKIPEGLSWGEEDSLPAYLTRTQWIIETAEWRQYPERYIGLEMPDSLKPYCLIVPLFLQQRLAGFIALACDGKERGLNFEDRDLLKTVGRQLATHIARQDLDAQVTESRQFDAYNKLTAFLMHDLKNVAAQLSLLASNAPKHRDNPEFFDDAMDTVSNSVGRLGKLIAHLQAPTLTRELEALELDGVLQEVLQRCVNRSPAPVLAAGSEVSARVQADADRLIQVLEHLLRNAQDATLEDGAITVTVRSVGVETRIEVADNGCGMSAEFVRDGLFKPFESTKGSKGMGIGAYQARESVRQMGGRVEVLSQPGHGTRFRIYLKSAVVEGADELTGADGDMAITGEQIG